MQTDGRTDMMKLIVAFRNFAKASTNPSGCIYETRDRQLQEKDEVYFVNTLRIFLEIKIWRP